MSRTRLLLVDDDDAFRRVMTTLLQRDGYACDSAADAHEAGAMLRRDDGYEVLICDREMPGNDDFALIRNLPPSYEHVPVVVVTAYPSVDSAIRALHMPVLAYLVKPVESAEMLAQVARAVEVGQMRRTLGASQGRLQAWMAELGQLEALIDAAPRDACETARGTLLAIQFDHLDRILRDIRAVAEVATQGAAVVASAAPPFGLRSEEQLALLQGLRETIAVLEKTKSSFKSRELGQLRRKLEGIFQAPAKPPRP